MITCTMTAITIPITIPITITILLSYYRYEPLGVPAEAPEALLSLLCLFVSALSLLLLLE